MADLLCARAEKAPDPGRDLEISLGQVPGLLRARYGHLSHMTVEPRNRPTKDLHLSVAKSTNGFLSPRANLHLPLARRLRGASSPRPPVRRRGGAQPRPRSGPRERARPTKEKARRRKGSAAVEKAGASSPVRATRPAPCPATRRRGNPLSRALANRSNLAPAAVHLAPPPSTAYRPPSSHPAASDLSPDCPFCTPSSPRFVPSLPAPPLLKNPTLFFAHLPLKRSCCRPLPLDRRGGEVGGGGASFVLRPGQLPTNDSFVVLSVGGHPVDGSCFSLAAGVSQVAT